MMDGHQFMKNRLTPQPGAVTFFRPICSRNSFPNSKLFAKGPVICRQLTGLYGRVGHKYFHVLCHKSRGSGVLHATNVICSEAVSDPGSTSEDALGVFAG